MVSKDSPNNRHVFWGEITPCEHLVQIYQTTDAFLDALEGFVAGGLRAGDAAVVIATEGHRTALEQRLRESGVDLDAAIARDQYLALDADESLSRFMVGDWPDDVLFKKFVGDLLTRLRRNGRHVRAFGEMVATLWAQGRCGATVRLEHLWHEVCNEESFSLFCAYPRIGFTQDAAASIEQICAAHSRVVPG